MLTGADRLFEPDVYNLLADRRIGLLCHAASVNNQGLYTFDVMSADERLRPRILLVPEHGLFGEAAYMEPVRNSKSPVATIDVVSLYGSDVASLTPPPDALDEIDVLVIDLQDVGARYYTYIATAILACTACAGRGIPVVVLDRPNPIGGVAVEGNNVDWECRSFVSWLSVPNRHGLTIGEALMLYRGRAVLDFDLTVVECRGLTRDMLWSETGLPFVPPSPNINSWEVALIYPGMCLLEGTNLSEGRGTTIPFFQFGAPWIDRPWAFVEELRRKQIPGVAFRPTYFTPNADKWAGQRCGGAHIMITDQLRIEPLRMGLEIVALVKKMYEERFELRHDPYEFVTDLPALDLLIGSKYTSAKLLAGMPVPILLKEMEPQRQRFLDRVRDLYIYH